MDKAHLDVVAACLDTAAFLLVTTDLYGESRLKELGERLSKPLRFDQVFWAIWLASMCVGYWLFYRYYEAHLAWFKQNSPLAMALAQDFTGVALIVLAVLCLPVTVAVMPVLSATSRAAAFLIDQWKMKGVFLVVGTMLYLAARAVSVLEPAGK